MTRSEPGTTSNGPWESLCWEWCRLSNRKGESSSPPPLLSVDDFAPIPAFHEAYTLIRTHLKLMSVDRVLGAILVTSPRPGDGKTTTAANLAISMARGGAQVWLVNGDLRRPSGLDQAFPHQDGVGLTTVLAGLSTLEDALTPTGVEGLSYVPPGPSVPSPPDLLGSQRMERFLEEAKAKISAVVLDCSPVMYAESLLLSTKVDGVLLVVRPGETPRGAAQGAVKQLKSVGANLLGVVLNNVRDHGPGYGYYYDRYYPGDGGR